jgi:hypothetical protein
MRKDMRAAAHIWVGPPAGPAVTGTGQSTRNPSRAALTPCPNGIKLSPNVHCINTLQVSRRALRSLVRAMHGAMTAWDVTVSRSHSSRMHET